MAFNYQSPMPKLNIMYIYKKLNVSKERKERKK